jgi:hypothetical protein
MTEPNIALKAGARVAVWVMVGLLVLSAIFYREKVLFGDGSYLLFNIINKSKVEIQWGRYGSIVSQLLPYLAVKLSLPIRIVGLLYAMGFSAFYLLSVAICYWCRQYALAILAALYFTLFFSDSFYWVSEVPQAVGFLFITLSVLLWSGERKVSVIVIYPVFFLLSFLTISTHFVVIIPFVFLWVYYLMGTQNLGFSKQRTIVLSLLLIAVVIFRFVTVGGKSGENSHLHNVTHFSIKDILFSFVSPVVTTFYNHLLTIYWPILFVFAAGMYAMVKKNGKHIAGWTILTCVGYIIIIGLTYGDHKGVFALFHIESEWGALSVIMAAAFVFEYLSQLKTKTVVVLLLAIFGVRMGYIYKSARVFGDRNEIKNVLVRKMKEKGYSKVALYENKKLSDQLILDWTLPEELMLGSAMNGDRPQLTCRFVRTADTATLKDPNMSDRVSFDFANIPNSELNAHYFAIDTSTPYVLLTYEALMK